MERKYLERERNENGNTEYGNKIFTSLLKVAYFLCFGLGCSFYFNAITLIMHENVNSMDLASVLI